MGLLENTLIILLLIAIVSTARGNPSAVAFGRRIPHIVVYRAMAVALLSVAVLALIVALLVGFMAAFACAARAQDFVMKPLVATLPPGGYDLTIVMRDSEASSVGATVRLSML